ncbi:integration host factor subunit alpha [Holospora elegans E1]|uniref:Integration host factor subunit alpha n=1 Tax=Holospora elegans E1 TaxID=1427503 RepID=A0A023DZ03_9PROT|nr:HU family DNA-binding protein [Holospora elegans]GAJ46756.1 integration host factor subunit alpha [Holospora elegans E1]GAJ46836.1 integration host factor subunit alpha [Holospora elegans E1]
MNINKNKLTRIPLRKSFQRNLKINEKEASYLLEKILDRFHKIFLNTKDPYIKISSFGTFVITNKKERTGRNPRTLEKTVILPRRKITFRSSKRLVERLNPASFL